MSPDVGQAIVIVALENVRGNLAAQVAVDAGQVVVIRSGNEVEYAHGASAPDGTFETPLGAFATEDSVNYLTLTAVIRTNDARLSAYGQSCMDMSGSPSAWTSAVVVSEASVDQSALPTGCVRKVFRTPMGAAQKSSCA